VSAVVVLCVAIALFVGFRVNARSSRGRFTAAPCCTLGHGRWQTGRAGSELAVAPVCNARASTSVVRARRSGCAVRVDARARGPTGRTGRAHASNPAPRSSLRRLVSKQRPRPRVSTRTSLARTRRSPFCRRVAQLWTGPRESAGASRPPIQHVAATTIAPGIHTHRPRCAGSIDACRSQRTPSSRAAADSCGLQPLSRARAAVMKCSSTSHGPPRSTSTPTTSTLTESHCEARPSDRSSAWPLISRVDLFVLPRVVSWAFTHRVDHGLHRAWSLSPPCAIRDHSRRAGMPVSSWSCTKSLSRTRLAREEKARRVDVVSALHERGVRGSGPPRRASCLLELQPVQRLLGRPRHQGGQPHSEGPPKLTCPAGPP